MMAIAKKPKVKAESVRSQAAVKKSGKAKADGGVKKSVKTSDKRAALRKMVIAALKSGTASASLRAAVLKKWPELAAADATKAEPQKKKRSAAAQHGAVGKKRKTEANVAVKKRKTETNVAVKKRKMESKPKEEEEEEYSGLSKKESKVTAILKKTAKPENLSRKERRALRVARRKDAPLVRELLRNWEELRSGHCEPTRRGELCTAIIEAARGKMRELVMAHDTSRVFESVMKHGNMEQRLSILEELKSDVPLLMKTKFAKFVVKKMLMHGSREHKNLVFSALEGAVAKMLVHRQAVEVLDTAFNDFANATQRANLVQEVYGPPFSLFKTPGAAKLGDAFTAEPKANKETVLKHMKDILTTAVTKGNTRFYIVHYLLSDFLDSCSTSDVSEIAQLLKEQLVPLLHTRDGVKVAMRCLWNANNKDRKVILKAMKTFFANTAVDEHGYLFILALLDAVDDIVFLRKTLIKELLEAPDILLGSIHGRKVLLYMLDRRSTCHFHPQLLDILKKGDTNPFTKKPGELRSQELRDSVLPVLLRFATDNLSTLCASNGGLMVLRQLLTATASSELLANLVRAVVRLLTDGEKVCEGKETFLESAAAHMALKKALQADRDEGGALSSLLFHELGEDNIETISSCNRGCFLLVHMCEANPATARDMRAILPVSKLNLSFPGAKILSKKLTGT